MSASAAAGASGAAGLERVALDTLTNEDLAALAGLLDDYFDGVVERHPGDDSRPPLKLVDNAYKLAGELKKFKRALAELELSPDSPYDMLEVWEQELIDFLAKIYAASLWFCLMKCGNKRLWLNFLTNFFAAAKEYVVPPASQVKDKEWTEILPQIIDNTDMLFRILLGVRPYGEPPKAEGVNVPDKGGHDLRYKERMFRHSFPEWPNHEGEDSFATPDAEGLVGFMKGLGRRLDRE